MIQSKNTRARGNSKSIREKAEQAERVFRANSREAATLPPAEIPRTSAAERCAFLELQSADGNEEAQARATAIRLREREDNAERERVRNGRKRPHKHLPAGLSPLSVTLAEPRAGRPVIRFAAEGTPGSQTLLHKPAEYRMLEVVTPELARAAAALRAAFDLESDRSGTPLVAREIANAIRLAAAEASAAWIPIALELVHHALLHSVVLARGALDLYELNGRPAPPMTPDAIYQALVSETVFPPPSDIDTGTISWMLSHLAFGATHGGGPTKRLSAVKMRAILADEKKRARVMAKPV